MPLFADPPEPGTPDVLYLGPGVHDLGYGVIDGTVLDTDDQAADENQPGLIDVAGSTSVVVNGPRSNVPGLGGDVTMHGRRTTPTRCPPGCTGRTRARPRCPGSHPGRSPV